MYEENLFNFLSVLLARCVCVWPTSKKPARRHLPSHKRRSTIMLCPFFSLLQYRGNDCSSFSSFFYSMTWPLGISFRIFTYLLYAPQQMWWIGINWQTGVHAEYSHLLDISLPAPTRPQFSAFYINASPDSKVWSETILGIFQVSKHPAHAAR